MRSYQNDGFGSQFMKAFREKSKGGRGVAASIPKVGPNKPQNEAEPPHYTPNGPCGQWYSAC